MKNKGKESKKMFLAFLLNLFFSVFELVGSFVTGSVAIASDALHDFGDAVTIGIACFLEKKSNRQPDEVYTYGYRRYSVVAGLFGSLVLLVGSAVVMVHAVERLLVPQQIHSHAMILFAVIGVVINFCAAYVTHGGDSVNQKAVNLHMMEDVLGWIAVLVGAVVIKLTGFMLIDPLLSIGVAVFVIVNAARNLRNALHILLEKAPDEISVMQIRNLLLNTPSVTEVHHIHLWTMDGQQHFVTMHLVTEEEPFLIKKRVKELLYQKGIFHVTLELETSNEHCHESTCTIAPEITCHHHHQH